MNNHRFAVLDGLRGVAALVVLCFHIVQQHDARFFPYAGLAVDFFYMLSGFVIAFAYGQKLETGAMRFRDFAWVRIARLYPLIVLGTATGIVLAFAAAAIKHNATFAQVTVSGGLGLLLLPSFVFPQWPTAYPMNMASWSLTFEFFINAVYAAIAPRLTTVRLIALTLCGAVALVAVAWVNHRIVGGNNQGNFVYGFGRVLFPFFMGVLLYRFRLERRANTALGASLLILLPCLLLVTGEAGPTVGLLYVLVAFPILVAFGAAVEVGPELTRFCRMLGELSFPVYILQSPLLRLGGEILKHGPFRAGEIWLFSIAEAAIIIGVAWLALKYFDALVQRMLRTRFAAQSDAAARDGALSLATAASPAENN